MGKDNSNYGGNPENQGYYDGNQGDGQYYGNGAGGDPYYSNPQGGDPYYNGTADNGGYYGGQGGDPYYGGAQNANGYYGNGQGGGVYYGNGQSRTYRNNGQNGPYYGNTGNGGPYYGNTQTGGSYYGNTQTGGPYYGNTQTGGSYYGNTQTGGPYHGNGGSSGTGGGGKRPKKKNSFTDIMSILLMVIALCVFLFSGYTLYGFYKEYKKGSDEYDNLEKNYTLEEEESEDFDSLEDDDALQNVNEKEVATVMENGQMVELPTMKNPINFTELQQVNDDIVGWLRIRALDISYPMVQAEDNDYYLHRTFEKEEVFSGCIFLNCDNKKDFTDTNSIVYGHNMKDGSMFAKLKNFGDKETFEKSKYFWVFTPDLIYQYRIFSAMVVNKVGLTYQTNFTDQDFQELINTAFSNSQVENSDVSVKKGDRIMTLFTCTGDDATRYVVMGKLAQVYASK